MLSGDVQEYLKKFGKRGANTLSMLGKYQSFKYALDSEFGKFLLGDMVNLHSSLLDRITQTGGTEEERAQFKVVTEMLTRYSRKLELYETKYDEFLKEVSPKGLDEGN